MGVSQRVGWLLAPALAVFFGLVACSGSQVPELPVQAVGSASQSAEGNSLSLDLAVPKVAGTYLGTIDEIEGSHHASGTVKIVMNQKGSEISGAFDITFGSQTKDLTFNGTVKAAKKGAALVFSIMNLGGRNASAKASVIGTKLKGTGHVAKKGSMPAVSLKFIATRRND